MSRLLLDTHTFLWWVNDATELSDFARDAISNENNECFFSVASCWEMAIKSSLGKLELAKPVDRFVLEQITENSFTILNIELRHAAKAEFLPLHHRDPFDRLLIGQALSDKLIIVTADRMFSNYGIQRIW